MKFISALLLLFVLCTKTYSQNPLPDFFLDGKCVVLISNAPQARPIMDWTAIAEEFHLALVAAGGDPVAYYELEDVIISEETQTAYAQAFLKRMIKSIVIVTRKANGELAVHIAPFTGDQNIVANANIWNHVGESLGAISQRFEEIENTQNSKNLLVLEVPEFPSVAASNSTSNKFIIGNPLNLEIFKLGIQLSGSDSESGFLSSYRYDLLGKSPESILAEQNVEKEGIEAIFNEYYPNQVEYLRTSKTSAELISERIQFLLLRVEAREEDLMKSMGVNVEDLEEKNRIVVKYYIKFLVRDELYIGPVWDAHPNWRIALIQFLENLKIK